MNRYVSILALSIALAGTANAQEEATELTPEQERELIGEELEANREQIGREVRALWEPGLQSDDQVDEETTVDNRPTVAGDQSPGVDVGEPRRSYPTGSVVPQGTAQPDDIRRPVTTPTPVPGRDGTMAPDGLPSAGRPAPGVTVDPLPGGATPAPNGNNLPGVPAETGGNGTIRGNAPGAAPTTGNPTGERMQ